VFFIKGDDHRAMCHVETKFRPPEPVLDDAAIVDPDIEKEEYATIVQVASHITGGANLDRGWWAHTGERFRHNGSSLGVILMIDIDTKSAQKTIQLRWYDVGDQFTKRNQLVYRADWADGFWHFPVEIVHRTNAIGIVPTNFWNPESIPGDPWDQDPEP
jgi:hypothetical protein